MAPANDPVLRWGAVDYVILIAREELRCHFERRSNEVASQSGAVSVGVETLASVIGVETDNSMEGMRQIATSAPRARKSSARTRGLNLCPHVIVWCDLQIQ